MRSSLAISAGLDFFWSKIIWICSKDVGCKKEDVAYHEPLNMNHEPSIAIVESKAVSLIATH